MNYRDIEFVRESVSDDDRAATRLCEVGPEAVRDDELLSVVLGDEERARLVLGKHALEHLVDMGTRQLRASGFPEAAARKTAACFELARRGLGKGTGILPPISCPSDALPYFAEFRGRQREHFVSLLLNARNQVIRTEVVSVGSLSASLVHPRELFAPAIEAHAAAVLVGHNHPSGDPTPSKDDVDLTRRLSDAGQLLGIQVLDHLVICEGDFVSLKEEGHM